MNTESGADISLRIPPASACGVGEMAGVRQESFWPGFRSRNYAVGTACSVVTRFCRSTTRVLIRRQRQNAGHELPIQQAESKRAAARILFANGPNQAVSKLAQDKAPA